MNWTLKICDNTVNEQGGNFHSRNRKRHDRMFLGRREHESFEEQMSWKMRNLKFLALKNVRKNVGQKRSWVGDYVRNKMSNGQIMYILLIHDKVTDFIPCQWKLLKFWNRLLVGGISTSIAYMRLWLQYEKQVEGTKNALRETTKKECIFLGRE